MLILPETTIFLFLLLTIQPDAVLGEKSAERAFQEEQTASSLVQIVLPFSLMLAGKHLSINEGCLRFVQQRTRLLKTKASSRNESSAGSGRTSHLINCRKWKPCSPETATQTWRSGKTLPYGPV